MFGLVVIKVLICFIVDEICWVFIDFVVNLFFVKSVLFIFFWIKINDLFIYYFFCKIDNLFFEERIKLGYIELIFLIF